MKKLERIAYLTAQVYNCKDTIQGLDEIILMCEREIKYIYEEGVKNGDLAEGEVG